jgi:hypothetical protein
MSYVIATPELMTSAATDLATIGSNVSAAHAAAAARTVAVLPAAADEVSAGIAHLFSAHAANYQAMAAQAAAFNDQFVQHLTAGAFSYASTEAALASLLQPLTASIGSAIGAIGALPGQLFNLVSAAVGQLLPDVIGFVLSQTWLQPLFPILGAILVLTFVVIIIGVLLLNAYFPNL